MSFAEYWKQLSLPDANFTTEQIAMIRKIASDAYRKGKKDANNKSL